MLRHNPNVTTLNLDDENERNDDDVPRLMRKTITTFHMA